MIAFNGASGVGIPTKISTKLDTSFNSLSVIFGGDLAIFTSTGLANARCELIQGLL
jgi:hypothetical protein